MATSRTAACISNSTFSGSNLFLTQRTKFISKQKQLSRWRCSVSPPIWRECRRLLSISIALAHFHFLLPDRAASGSIFDKYVKRKKLEPLEVYVPAVILTELQITDLEKVLDGDKPEYAACRTLLRSGPAASLRVNIRAVAQYASESGNGTSAFNNVNQCLRALEDLDSLLLRASRKDPDASLESMKTKINTARTSLDSLLQTVPSHVLEKGKIVAESYRTEEYVETESSTDTEELKQLESIL